MPSDYPERFMEAFKSGDRDAIMALVHPDYEVIQSNALPYGGTYRGHAGFEEFALGIFPQAWNLDTFDVLAKFWNPEVEPGIEDVVLLLHFAGTVPATGKRFDTTVMERWVMKDGKMIAVKPHWFEAPPAD